LSLSSTQIATAVIWVALFFLVAGPVHECAHAITAMRNGDRTAKLYGRVSLDPIVHFDPVGGPFLILSVVVGLLGSGVGGLGWAKPTPVNPMNLRGRFAESKVAAAGPISNLLLACLFSVGLRICLNNGLFPDATSGGNMVALVFFTGVELNVWLMLFNLIPVAPLDGSHVLFDLLDPATSRSARQFMDQYGIMLLLVVILFAGRLLQPIAQPIISMLTGLQFA
jgi:Zn-dependent protease